jgi:hypothetical protein
MSWSWGGPTMEPTQPNLRTTPFLRVQVRCWPMLLMRYGDPGALVFVISLHGSCLRTYVGRQTSFSAVGFPTRRHVLFAIKVRRMFNTCLFDAWIWALCHWGKPGWLPTVNTYLVYWWTSRIYPPVYWQDMSMVIILVFWCIWQHQNDMVFNCVSVDISVQG